MSNVYGVCGGGAGGIPTGGWRLILWGVLTPAPTPDLLIDENPLIFLDLKLYRLVDRYNFLQTFFLEGKLKKFS